jgi:Protein of unknown function (DUF3341)
MTNREWIVGSFADEGTLKEAVRRVREAGLTIHDVYTPYAVHGLDELMGLRRSRLGYVTLAGGLVGMVSAIVMQVWAAVVDWPINVGGKPANSALAFVPITFELTVLVAGLSTAAAFVLRSKLRPPLPFLPSPAPFAPRITNDAFVLVVERDAEGGDGTASLLRSLGARQVRQEVVQP